LEAGLSPDHPNPSPRPGRKSLYFDPGKIVDFVGIERAEGDELIAELEGAHDRAPTPSTITNGKRATS
jgi:hypothetical protein